MAAYLPVVRVCTAQSREAQSGGVICKYFKYFIIILIVSTNYKFVHLLDNKNALIALALFLKFIRTQNLRAVFRVTAFMPFSPKMYRAIWLPISAVYWLDFLKILVFL